MKINKSMTVSEETDEGIRYLRNLAPEVYTEYPTENRYGDPVTGIEETTRKLTQNELERILKIADSNDNLVLIPDTIDFDFGPAFRIYRLEDFAPGVEPEKELILYFAETQLPEGDNFNTIKAHFISDRNLEKARHYGFEVDKNRMSERCNYDY